MSGSLPVLPLSRLSRNSRRMLCSRSLCPGPRLRRHGVRGGRRAQGSFKGKPLGRSNGREMFGRRIRPSVRIRPGERAVVRAGREGLNAGSERAYIVFGRQGTLFRPHVRPGSGRGLQRPLFTGGGGIRIHRGHSRGSVRILGNARGVLLRRDRPAGSCGGRRGRARPCRRHPAKRGCVFASVSSGRGDRDAIAGRRRGGGLSSAGSRSGNVAPCLRGRWRLRCGRGLGKRLPSARGRGNGRRLRPGRSRTGRGCRRGWRAGVAPARAQRIGENIDHHTPRIGSADNVTEGRVAQAHLHAGLSGLHAADEAARRRGRPIAVEGGKGCLKSDGDLRRGGAPGAARLAGRVQFQHNALPAALTGPLP